MLVAMAIGIGVGQAFAADWKFTPRIGVSETYTDNVRLAARGQEQSDFITEVDPGFSLSARGARLQVQASYSLRYRLYSNNSSANGQSQALQSNALMDVWDRKLFLQASAGISQQQISTLGALPTSDVNITNNQTEVRQTTISPYWQSRLSNWANLQARFTWSQAESSGQTSALNSETQAATIGISSGPAFSDLGWSLTYSRSSTESSSGQFSQRDIESVSGTVRYRVMPTLTALATVGRDHNTYGSTRGSTGGEFYDIGFEWIPSTRTKVAATLGERYFGNTYSLNAEHRTRLTSWTVLYSEQIIATPGQYQLPGNVSTAAALDRLFISQFPDPVERQQVVQAFIAITGLPQGLPTTVDFLTNQVSLSKRLQGTAALRGTRGSFLLSVYRESRTNENAGSTTTILGTDPFSVSNSVVQTGYSGVLSWRFSERASGSVSLGQSKATLPDTGREDINSNFRVGLTYQLQPKVQSAVEYRWSDRDSNGASSVRENAVRGTLSMTF